MRKYIELNNQVDLFIIFYAHFTARKMYFDHFNIQFFKKNTTQLLT